MFYQIGHCIPTSTYRYVLGSCYMYSTPIPDVHTTDSRPLQTDHVFNYTSVRAHCASYDNLDRRGLAKRSSRCKIMESLMISTSWFLLFCFARTLGSMRRHITYTRYAAGKAVRRPRRELNFFWKAVQETCHNDGKIVTQWVQIEELSSPDTTVEQPKTRTQG
jgi:hypothetical protein